MLESEMVHAPGLGWYCSDACLKQGVARWEAFMATAKHVTDANREEMRALVARLHETRPWVSTVAPIKEE
jgi:hypothetical protein